MDFAAILHWLQLSQGIHFAHQARTHRFALPLQSRPPHQRGWLCTGCGWLQGTSDNQQKYGVMVRAYRSILHSHPKQEEITVILVGFICSILLGVATCLHSVPALAQTNDKQTRKTLRILDAWLDLRGSIMKLYIICTVSKWVADKMIC